MAYSSQWKNFSPLYGVQPLLLPANIYRERHRKQRTLHSITSRQSMKIVSRKIHSSTNPFADLEDMSMSDLRCEIPAFGKYLILRNIENAYVTLSWNTVVEDNVGNVCDFRLFNYPEHELFPVGTMFILKEPYYECDQYTTGYLKCESPTDIIVLRRSHPMYNEYENVQWKNEIEQLEDPLFSPTVPTTPDMWKERGNSFYSGKKYILAGEAYTLGLNQCEDLGDIWRILQLNLSAVWLMLGYYDKTVTTAENVLQAYPDDLKGLLRVGRGHYFLRDYKKALEKFEKALIVDANYAEAKVELKKTRKRISEQENEVDVRKLELKCLLSPMQKVNYADFVGPVKVVNIPGKDRGVVVTKDVPVGALLMVSKAFSANFGPEENAEFLFDGDHKIISVISKTLANLSVEVCHMVAKNPKTFGPLIYDLTTGVIPREEVQVFCDPETKIEPIVDVDKINAITYCNSFAIQDLYSGKNIGSALFILPSYMNHSCVPNATFDTYHDVMLIHSSAAIKAGDEVCISYVRRDRPPEERKILLAHRLTKCLCPTCKLESKMSKKEKKLSKK